MWLCPSKCCSLTNLCSRYLKEPKICGKNWKVDQSGDSHEIQKIESLIFQFHSKGVFIDMEVQMLLRTSGPNGINTQDRSFMVFFRVIVIPKPSQNVSGRLERTLYCTLDPRFKSHTCLQKYLIKRTWLYCCRQEVSRCCTRGESEESITCTWANRQMSDPPLLWNQGQVPLEV